MVISYEIYETSLRRVSQISYEMTTSVRFCLSYDSFKWGFIASKIDINSIENITLSRTASWRYAPVIKCYVTCGHTIFMTWRYPLNNSDAIWLKDICYSPWQNLHHISISFWYSDVLCTSQMLEVVRNGKNSICLPILLIWVPIQSILPQISTQSRYFNHLATQKW